MTIFQVVAILSLTAHASPHALRGARALFNLYPDPYVSGEMTLSLTACLLEE